jgi:hypothetical protein
MVGLCSVADPGPGVFYPRDPVFFPDLGSRIFLTKTKTLLLKALEARKKVPVSLHPTFHVESGIRYEKMFRSGIKHPGSATLGFLSLWHTVPHERQSEARCRPDFTSKKMAKGEYKGGGHCR